MRIFQVVSVLAACDPPREEDVIFGTEDAGDTWLFGTPQSDTIVGNSCGDVIIGDPETERAPVDVEPRTGGSDDGSDQPEGTYHER